MNIQTKSSEVASRTPRLEYIRRVPAELPEGKYLVHNRVTAQRQMGRNGFRVWLSESTTELVECHCGFSGIKNSELYTHYTTSDNADRPHWIELPNDDDISPELRDAIQGLCFNPSDEIEMAVRQLMLMLPKEHYEDVCDWLDELLHIREFFEDEDEDDENVAA